MTDIRSELHYTLTHEWLSIENGVATVGITDHAQDLLGDLVFIELPDIGSHVHQTDEVGVVESVKAASDYYAPVSGEIIEVNDDVAESPAILNADPFGDGWLFKIKLKDESELKDLLDAHAYAEHIAQDA